MDIEQWRNDVAKKMAEEDMERDRIARRSSDLRDSSFGPADQQEGRPPLFASKRTREELELEDALFPSRRDQHVSELFHARDSLRRAQHTPLPPSPTVETTATAQPIPIPTGRQACPRNNPVFDPERFPRTAPICTPTTGRPDNHLKIRNIFTESPPPPTPRPINRDLSFGSSPFTKADSTLMFNMSETYIPTSPLSAQHPRAFAPPQTKRKTHVRQTSRNMQMSLPMGKYYPTQYNRHAAAATPSAAGTPSPAIVVNAPGRQPASPVPPFRKHLDSSARHHHRPQRSHGDRPLALELEEPTDYFAVKRGGKPSPAGSPGAVSTRSDKSSGGESSGKRGGN
ncbi:uncharacterized protein AB675_7113 [Cyphellophora attinorum]|uniref:Uncharacterized protein n=1 Tax=Cyphellophora attinorum TaxID=1664694 RepID=A0A0N0NQ77_9EURO|nr:uncharacterized protein AB675_7113 [Phialophora attinorum]KPI43588.1 hypothetical protein AB675_7113 [Phialophora attinorum]